MAAMFLCAGALHAARTLDKFQAPAPPSTEPTFEVKTKNQSWQSPTFKAEGTQWFPLEEMVAFLGGSSARDFDRRLDDLRLVGNRMTIALRGRRNAILDLKTSEATVDGHTVKLPHAVKTHKGKLYVSMPSLPVIFGEDYLFALKDNVLYVEYDQPILQAPEVVVRSSQRRDARWVAFRDVAEAVGAVVSETGINNEYLVLLPNFKIRKIRIGDRNVEEDGNVILRLFQAPELWEAELYVTLDTARQILETPLYFDEEEKQVLVPERNAILGIPIPQAPPPPAPGKPFPLALDVDYLDMEYQPPSTGDKTFHSDDVRGRLSASLTGHEGPVTVTGRGSGFRSQGVHQMSNASLKVETSRFYARGGRDTFNIVGLTGLQVFSDHGVFGSHADWDQGRFRFNVDGGGGTHEFTAFASSDTFSESLTFRQHFYGGVGSFQFPFVQNTNMTLRLGGFGFETQVADLTRSGFPAVDPGDSVSLLRDRVATPDHQLGLSGLSFDSKYLSFTGDVAVSRFTDVEKAKRVYDQNWDTRATVRLTERASVDLSYEEIGPDYRAMSNPTSYQDQVTKRVAPSFQAARFLWFSGELRRQIFHPSQNPTTQDSRNLSARISMGKNNLTLSGTNFEDNVSGTRNEASADFDRQSGKFSGGLQGRWQHSEDLQGNPTQTTWNGNVRAGYAWNDKVRVSLNQQIQRNDYISSGILNKWDSVTNFSTDINSFRFLMRYSSQPNLYSQDPRTNSLYTSMGYQVTKEKMLAVYYSASANNYNFNDVNSWTTGLRLTSGFW